MIKVVASIILLGVPILALLWMIRKELIHRGRMEAYDRIANAFKPKEEDNG